MNGKIKTKFAALFAVALMITVCVVPMVGGSEDVEAATSTDTIDISGIVKNAKGDGWAGIEVYIEGTDISDITDDADDGEFELENVPVKDTIIVKVNVGEYLSDGKTKNPAAGYSFASITLAKATDNVDGLEFVAGTITISGSLEIGSSKLIKDGVSVKQSTTTLATTDEGGEFSFVADANKDYELKATLGGVDFVKKVTGSNTDTNVGLKPATDAEYLFIKASAPFGKLTQTNEANKEPIFTVDVDDLDFVSVVESGDVVYYALVPFETDDDADGTVTLTMKYVSDDKWYGIESKKIEDIGDPSAITGDFISNDCTIGKVTVGGIPVTPTSVSITGKDGSSSKTINACVIDDLFFCGTKYTSSDETKAITLEIKVDVKYGAYVFPQTLNSEPYEATNDVKVTVKSNSSDEFTVDTTNPVVDQNGYTTQPVDDNGDDIVDYYAFDFYVPYGKSVTVKAPANYAPASEKADKVYSNTEFNFVYSSKVEYIGKVLLNGIPVIVGTPDLTGKEISTFRFSVNGGEKWHGAHVYWSTDEDGLPYYTLSIDRKYDASDIMVKMILDDDNEASGYLFEENEDDEGYTAAVGITGTTIGAFNVEASEINVTAKDGELTITGMEVSFYMLKDASAFDEDLIVADLGKATTDADGIATLKTAAMPVSGDDYSIFAVTDGDSDFGAYSKKDIKISAASENLQYGSYLSGSYNTSKTIYGFYTADATAIPGLEIPYIEYSSTDLVGNGKATIVDNMYYIILDDGNIVDLKVNTDVYKLGASDVVEDLGAGRHDITLSVIAEDNSVEVEILENEYFKFIEVNEPTTPVKGDVVVLSAEKTCYKIQNDVFGYQYTDAAVEYTFAGWYVNGKLLTEDCDASLTLTEDVVIVAQYEEAVKVIGSQDVPEAGLDTNVLILGIVVVVIALIAVVYSVISKRD